jgi:hypothetical protein
MSRHTQFLSEAETATRLGVTVRHLYNLRKREAIPYLRIGGAIRYCWPDVVAALKVDAAKGGE